MPGVGVVGRSVIEVSDVSRDEGVVSMDWHPLPRVHEGVVIDCDESGTKDS